MKVLEWSQFFSHYKSMGIFPEAQGQFTPKSLFELCGYFELIQDFMVVLITCKSKEPIKTKELEWSQDFLHYNNMGAICCHGNQSPD